MDVDKIVAHFFGFGTKLGWGLREELLNKLLGYCSGAGFMSTESPWRKILASVLGSRIGVKYPFFSNRSRRISSSRIFVSVGQDLILYTFMHTAAMTPKRLMPAATHIGLRSLFLSRSSFSTA